MVVNDSDIVIGVAIDPGIFQKLHPGGDGKCLFAGHLSESSEFYMKGWSLSRETPKTNMLPVKAMSGTARGVDGWNITPGSVGENGHAKRQISFGAFLSKRKVRSLYWREHIVPMDPDPFNEPEIDTAPLKMSPLGGDEQCLFAGHIPLYSEFLKKGRSLSREPPKTKMLPVKAMSGTARGGNGWNQTPGRIGENGHAKRQVSFGTFLFKRKVRSL